MWLSQTMFSHHQVPNLLALQASWMVKGLSVGCILHEVSMLGQSVGLILYALNHSASIPCCPNLATCCPISAPAMCHPNPVLPWSGYTPPWSGPCCPSPAVHGPDLATYCPDPPHWHLTTGWQNLVCRPCYLVLERPVGWVKQLCVPGVQHPSARYLLAE